MSKLSDRIRPNVEAAPWVIEEIKEIETALEELNNALELSNDYWPVWVGTPITKAAHQKQLAALQILSKFFP